MLSKLKELFDSFVKYVTLKLDELKLEAADRVSLIVADIAAIIILALFGILFIILLSVAASLFIGYLLSSYFLGFLIVAFACLLLGYLIYLFRNKIISKPVRNWMINKVLGSSPQKR